MFKRTSAPPPVDEPVDAVQRARTRARQRLIGAVVLLAIGVVGFPLVFETQPRPIPVDIPIEIPRKEGAPYLGTGPSLRQGGEGSNPTAAATAGPGLAPAPASHANDDPGARSPAAAGGEMITESREEAGTSLPAPDPARAPEGRPTRTVAPAKPAARPEAGRPESRTAQRSEPKVEAKSDKRPDAPASPPDDDAARARALLDGRSPLAAAPAAEGAARFIVQVGAFADASAAQGTRQKIERLGFKTYTQIANTPAGSRIRVRMGPFASRDEADKALARARSAGLGAVLLAL